MKASADGAGGSWLTSMGVNVSCAALLTPSSISHLPSPACPHLCLLLLFLRRRVVATLTSTVGAQHPDALTALSNLAVVCKAMGDYEQAESLCRQALAALKSTHGSDDNPDTLTFTNNLAAVLFAQGKYVEAESHYRKALEESERLQVRRQEGHAACSAGGRAPAATAAALPLCS